MIELERDKSDVVKNLEYLSDRIGPRLTGSARLKAANDWTAKRMRDYGLENVHLEGWSFSEGWERGWCEARIIEPNGLPISIAQSAWSPPTNGALRGKVVRLTAEDEGAFKSLHNKLRGAIIFDLKEYHAPSPGGLMGYNAAQAEPDIPALVPPTAAAPSPSTPSRPFNFEEFMARMKRFNNFLRAEGAAAVISVSAKPYALLDMHGSPDSRWGRATLPSFIIANENGGQIDRLIRGGVRVTMEVRGDGHPVKGPLTVSNTVGEIRGSDKPDEVVILGAHLDSWDLGTGTTDNGTGSVAVLEAARLIKSLGARPSRTIRFILFSGEEQGLLGSAAYVKAHKSEMPNINAMFVHDIGTGRVKGLWLQNRSVCKPLIEKEFARFKELGLLTNDPEIEPGKMNGTDHASFDDAGVPAFSFKQAAAEYGLSHHSQIDTMERVRPSDLKQGALALAIFAWDAAQMADRYPRK
jgi:carboxypeptidase Q